MKELIETLFKFGPTLLGAGYDNAIKWLNQLIGLEVLEVPSGTKFGTWTVPDEWVPKESWVKLNGEKIIDFSKNPLALTVYSAPFKGKVDIKELKNHLHTNPERHEVIPYSFNFYERDWGFSVPYDQYVLLGEGEYEVFIDTEFRPGKMKIGVHTIPGKTDREVLLFAHLDHPYQANDNLSGVACLVDLAKRLKVKHTVKIIFCPETIGSIAYANIADISKVDFVIAVDICGNDNSILLQKPFNREHRLTRAANMAVRAIGDHRIADFRANIGSDEYYFNDPIVGIPGIMFSTWPYQEYHSSDDTPEKINYDSIKKVQEAIEKTIKYYEQDFIPERIEKGPVMRSKYNLQTHDKLRNVYYDYFFYFMDGKKYLSELCAQYGVDFEQAVEFTNKMIKDGVVKRTDSGKKRLGAPAK